MSEIYLSTICNADGSDESDKMAWAVKNYSRVVWDAVDGVYGIGGRAVVVPSDRELVFNARLVRVGERQGAFFVNSDQTYGNNNISITGLKLNGTKQALGLYGPQDNPSFNMPLIRIVAHTKYGVCKGITLENMNIWSWPGTVARMHNVHHVLERNIRMNAIHRGGLVHAYGCLHGTILNCHGNYLGDDGIAWNSVEALAGNEDPDKIAPSYDWVVRNSSMGLQDETHGGNPIAIRGGSYMRVVDWESWGGVNSGALIGESSPYSPATNDIVLRNFQIHNSLGHGVHVIPNVGSVRLTDGIVHDVGKEKYKIRNTQTVRTRCV